MASHEFNILGSELAHAPTFRDDVANELMTFLQSTLLVGLVRIAVKNASTPFSIHTTLDTYTDVYGSLNSASIETLEKYLEV